MLTVLDPNYTLDDTTAFVIGDHEKVSSGDKIPIYIPAVMSEIEKSDEMKEETDIVTDPCTIYANVSLPNIAGTITKINYVMAEVTDTCISEHANIALKEEYMLKPDRAKSIYYIPTEADLIKGEQVTVISNLHCLLDLKI